MTELQHAPKQSVGMWLTQVRRPFLDFLRNLTPQILLASLAWLLAYRLDFSKIEIANWIPTVGFFAFVVLFAYAFYANTTLFFEEAFKDLIGWFKEKERAFKGSVPQQRYASRLLGLLFRERTTEVVLFIIVLLLLEFVFTGVIAFSVSNAAAVVKATK